MAKMDFFSGVEVVPAKKAPSSKAKSDEMIPTKGLEDYAIICAAETVIKSFKEMFADNLKNEMRKRFIQMGLASKKKPTNYKAFEGSATASMELRKRGENSPLTDEQIEVCEEIGVPLNVVVEKDETFIINPKYKDDAELRAKLNAALSKIPGLPADFLQYQEGKTKTVVTVDTEEALYKLGENKLKAAFDLVEVLAIKPKVDPEEMPQTKVFERLAEIVGR